MHVCPHGYRVGVRWPLKKEEKRQILRARQKAFFEKCAFAFITFRAHKILEIFAEEHASEKGIPGLSLTIEQVFILQNRTNKRLGA